MPSAKTKVNREFEHKHIEVELIILDSGILELAVKLGLK
jgi:hypothetical protein